MLCAAGVFRDECGVRTKNLHHSNTYYSSYVICGVDGKWVAKFARLDPPQLEWEMYNNKRNESTYPNP